jgi:iron complex transport system substrate-binding protein
MSRRAPRSPRRTLGALTLAGVVLLAACGDDDSADGSVPASDAASAASDAPMVGSCEGTFPVTVTGGSGEVTLDAAPERIVMLSPTHTEMVFAIGAGDQVVAVDDQSNYPAAAVLKSSSLSGYEPNVESIAGYEPDLVVVGDDFTGLTEQLASLDIPVWSGPTATSLDDVYAQITQLGQLTGCVGGAAATVADMRTKIETAVAGIEPVAEPLTYYYELDDTYYSVTSTSFMGQMLGLFGLRSIADGVSEGNDYPQLSAEAIIEADPDLIFLADTKCCGQSAETVAARPGWGGIAAVTNGNVIVLDDDIASRWGPRLVELVAAVSQALSGSTTG